MQYLLRAAKLILLLFALNLLVFSFAHYGRTAQLEHNPFFTSSEEPAPVLPAYTAYLKELLSEGKISAVYMQGVNLVEVIFEQAKASLGLLAISFTISVLLGLVLGILAARTNPPGISRFLIPLSTMSLAMPGFYVGAILVTLSVFALLYTPVTQKDLYFPLGGFGWDKHLFFPVIALSFRSSLYIALSTATLLASEFTRPYVTVARAFGYSWNRVKYKAALRNVRVSLVQVIGNSLNLMIGELIMVEWLFSWPGLGRQLALTMHPPETASIFAAVLPSSYMHAPTLASVVTVLISILLLSNFLVSVITLGSDARLAAGAQEAADV